MYVYQITNNINGKIYIGITNNTTKRWANHKCNNDPNQVIARAIRKYGKENFTFEILFKGLSIEEASEKEIELIKEKNSLVPNGYNVAKGGMYNAESTVHHGAENGMAKLTEEEAQYIKDNRNIPLYILYDEFSDKIGYEAFRECYYGQTYSNLSTTTEPYPYNMEFSNQFSGGTLDYDQVVSLRERYAKGEYWRKVYEDYKDLYPDEWTFWNVYYGNRYKLVMPEVFTEENRHKHAGMSKAGTLNGRAKLTEKDVLDIRAKHKAGISNSEIYKAYPQVTTTSIRAVINGETWKHLL